jgi:hypothetical protein
MRKVLPAVIAGLALAFPLFSAPAGAIQSRSAVSCDGASCSGRDPVETGCDKGAYKVDTAEFTDNRSKVHKIHLIYSPACHANWATIEPAPNNWEFIVKNWKGEQVRNKVQYGWWQYDPGYWWGDMVDGTGWAQACYLNGVCTRKV